MTAMLQLGARSLMDVEQAYRQTPVHSKYCGRVSTYFVDTVLPIGLRSATIIFTAVADDFVLLGPPDTDRCERNLFLLTQSCESLGLPSAQDKTEGPATRITVLGIEFEMVSMELRLLEDELQKMIELPTQWQGRVSGTRRDLVGIGAQGALSFEEYTTC